MTRRLSFVVTFGLVAAAAFSASAEPASKASFDFFRTPSGNIGCVYNSAEPDFAAGLRCDIRSGLRNPTVGHPKSCMEDYGDSIAMGKRGRPHLVCHGDTVFDPRARVLGYGTTWKRDGFTCRSETTGLRCTNPSRHGFFLSRERWSRF
jgi:uncharacterized protein DUF6636